MSRAAALRQGLAAAAASMMFLSPAQAASVLLDDACYVRGAGGSAAAAPAAEAMPGHLGLRRRATQLVDVDLSLTGDALAQCSITGTARVRGAAGAEFLVLPVRPDVPAASARDAALCLVRIEAVAGAIELSSTEPACRAQGVCGGRVTLHGQRFELATRAPAGASAPCFAR